MGKKSLLSEIKKLRREIRKERKKRRKVRKRAKTVKRKTAKRKTAKRKPVKRKKGLTFQPRRKVRVDNRELVPNRKRTKEFNDRYKALNFGKPRRLQADIDNAKIGDVLKLRNKIKEDIQADNVRNKAILELSKNIKNIIPAGKMVNPKTKRLINIGGATHKKLQREERMKKLRKEKRAEPGEEEEEEELN